MYRNEENIINENNINQRSQNRGQDNNNENEENDNENNIENNNNEMNQNGPYTNEDDRNYNTYSPNNDNNQGTTLLKDSTTFTANGTYTVSSSWINSGVTFKIESSDDQSGLKSIVWKWNTTGNAADTGCSAPVRSERRTG